MKKKILILVSLIVFLFGIKTIAQNIEVSASLPIRIYNDIMGINSNISQVNKFGRNIIVDTAQEADIWDGGASSPGNQIYNYEGFLTEASAMRLVSTSNVDSIGTTGARTVQIFGLDSNWLEQNEVITLLGTDTIITDNTYMRLFRMMVITAGSGASNAGKITAHAVGTVRMAQIDTARNQTLMAIYTIPGNKIGYLTSHYGGMNNRKQATCVPIYLLSCPSGQVFQTKSLLGVLSAGGSYYNHVYTAPLRFEPRTDIKMRTGRSTADGVDMSAGFDVILIDK